MRKVLGMRTFGMSAPMKIVAEHSALLLTMWRRSRKRSWLAARGGQADG